FNGSAPTLPYSLRVGWPSTIDEGTLPCCTASGVVVASAQAVNSAAKSATAADLEKRISETPTERDARSCSRTHGTARRPQSSRMLTLDVRRLAAAEPSLQRLE